MKGSKRYKMGLDENGFISFFAIVGFLPHFVFIIPFLMDANKNREKKVKKTCKAVDFTFSESNF